MWTPEFAKRGWVKDLSAYLKDPDLTPAGFDYPDGFYGTYITGNYPEGNQWQLPAGVFGMPWIAGFQPLYYRTDLLEQAGLVDEAGKAKPPATMEELLDYAKKLNDRPIKVYGYVMPASQPRIVYDWSGFLWTYGGDYLDEELQADVQQRGRGAARWRRTSSSARWRRPGLAPTTSPRPGPRTCKAAPRWPGRGRTWASVARTESKTSASSCAPPPPTHEGRRISLLGAIVASFWYHRGEPGGLPSRSSPGRCKPEAGEGRDARRRDRLPEGRLG